MSGEELEPTSDDKKQEEFVAQQTGETERMPREEYLNWAKDESHKLIDAENYRDAIIEFVINMGQYEENNTLSTLGFFFLAKPEITKEDALKFVDGAH